MSRHVLVRNAADPRQRDAAERRDRREARQRYNFFAQVLGTYEGRAVFAMLIDAAGLYLPTLGGAPDLTQQFLGRRNFGLELREEILVDHPEAFTAMELEAIDRRKRLDRELEAIATTRKQADVDPTADEKG